MIKNPQLETKRLMLRWIKPSDSPFVLKLLNEPSFIQNIGDRKIRDTAGAEGYIQKIASDGYEKLGYGSFLVLLLPTLEPIGICSLIKRDYLKDADIGFAFLSQFEGQGIATEASKAVIEYCRSAIRLKRIVGIASSSNKASMRVLEKLGLKFESLVLPPGESKEINLLSLEL